MIFMAKGSVFKCSTNTVCLSLKFLLNCAFNEPLPKTIKMNRNGNNKMVIIKW